MEKTIEIPEGYKARIEGDKVILENNESEDERIRKTLLRCCDDWDKGQYGTMAKKDVAKIRAYLEKQKEQKPAEIDEEHKVGKWFTGLIPCWIDAPSTLQPAHRYHGKNVIAIHLKDGGYRCCCVDDKKPITFRVAEDTHLVEGWKDRKPAEWSEEDEMRINHLIGFVEKYGLNYYASTDKVLSWLKSLRPQPKQESEPIEIKYAGKIYKVYGTKELPGGIVGYIIEDEPGHYDCIIHPDEVLGGGYGVKSNGSPYPTKDITFDEKPTEWSEEDNEKIGRLRSIVNEYACRKGALDVNGDYCEGDYEKLDNWLKDLPNRFALQPKQEWSEEDEETLACAISVFEDFAECKNISVPPASAKRYLKRLKSLRPQPKQKWSQEDNDFADDAIACVTRCHKKYIDNKEFYQSLRHNTMDIIRWLIKVRKRLTPQWKPSEEQMEQLRSAAVLPEFGPMVTTKKQFPDLESLYNDLKKL